MSLSHAATAAILIAAATPLFAQAQMLASHVAVENQQLHRAQETYLAPKGWAITDTYTWHPVQQELPVLLTQVHQIKSPDGKVNIDWVQNLASSWSTTAITIGSYTANAHEQRTDQGTAETEKGTDMTLELFAKSHPGTDVKVISRSDMPYKSMFDTVIANTPPPAHGGLRPTAAAYKSTTILTFSSGGLTMLYLNCSIYDRLRWDSTDDGTRGSKGFRRTSGTWVLRRVFECRAPVTQFKAISAMTDKMLASIRVDRAWQRGYEQIKQTAVAESAARINGKLQASRNALQNSGPGRLQSNANSLALQDSNRLEALNQEIGAEQARIFRNSPLEVRYIGPNIEVTIDHNHSQDQ